MSLALNKENIEMRKIKIITQIKMESLTFFMVSYSTI